MPDASSKRIMSGHSKWSKVKHQKEATDAVKGKIFTKLAAAIIIAVREGGGITDPDTNFRLRLAIEKARASNVPKENIERAIEKGAGKGEGALLEKQVYEAYGPGKVAIIIEALTDNHQRTTAMVKNILDKGGGVLTAQGAVNFMFTYVGHIVVDKSGHSFDSMMELVIEAGGEDLIEDSEVFVVFTRPSDLHKVKENLVLKNLKIYTSELSYKATTTMSVPEGDRVHLEALLTTLEEADDVQKVYTNAN